MYYCDANNLYRWAMSKKLPVDDFIWGKNTSNFDESFTKNYNENNDKGYILEVDVEYLKQLHDSNNHLLFQPAFLT